MWPRILCSLFLLAAHAYPSLCAAEAPKPSSPTQAWKVQSFSASPKFWRQSAANADPFAPAAPPVFSVPPPALPPEDAPASVWEKHIREARDFWTDACNKMKRTPPPGTLFLWDDASSTMAVRSTPEWLEEFQYMCVVDASLHPSSISLTLDIFESHAESVRLAVADTSGKPDHIGALRRLETLAAQGRATVIRHLQVETRSGQPVKTSEGVEKAHAEGLLIDTAGRVEVIRGSRCTGTMLEVDPAIGQDGRRVELRLAMEHHFGPPVSRRAFAGLAGTLGMIESPVTDYRMAKLQTSLLMEEGTARLLGVWTPEGVDEPNSRRLMQVAFLRTDILPLMPARTLALGPTLELHGPAVTPGDPPPPDGMVTRCYRVPPGVYPNEFRPPFNPPPPPGLEGVMRATSARDDFENMGLPFPEGASAGYDYVRRIVFMRNTPANQDMFEKLLMELADWGPSHVIAPTLQIVEGDGAILRQLAAAARTVADHGPLLKEVETHLREGRLKRVCFTRLEAHSGQRALWESGTLRMEAAGLAFGAAKPNDKVDNETVDPQGPPVKAESPAPATTDHQLMRVEHEARMAGTRLEIDPVLGPDGYTIDVNVALEHHFAPPTTPPVDAASEGKTLRVALPATEYHCASISTALTFGAGMTKLLTLWKPEGAPHAEGKDIMQAAFLRVDLAPIRDGHHEEH